MNAGARWGVFVVLSAALAGCGGSHAAGAGGQAPNGNGSGNGGAGSSATGDVSGGAIGMGGQSHGSGTAAGGTSMGTAGSPSQGSGNSMPGCITIQPGALVGNAYTQYDTSISPPNISVEMDWAFTPSIGSAGPNQIDFVYQEGGGIGFGNVLGTTQFGPNFSSDFNCGDGVRCLSIQIDVDGVNYQKLLYPTTGSLTVTNVTSKSLVTRETAGHMDNVTLVEVAYAPDIAQYEGVNGGLCLYLPSLTWDTTVPVGIACSVPSDCGDTTVKICDPNTNTCSFGVCDAETLCKSGTCLSQTSDAAIGACYPSCTPFASGCDGACIPNSVYADQGGCVAAGSAVDGAACSPLADQTGCIAGEICSPDDGDVCRALCDYWGGTLGCGSGQRCTPSAVCTAGSADAASIGKNCSAASPDGSLCGDDGTSYRGFCAGAGGSCTQLCMTASQDCPSGQRCYEFTDEPDLGYCD